MDAIFLQLQHKQPTKMSTLSQCNFFMLSILISLVIISSSMINLSESAHQELCHPIDKKALLQIKAALGPNATVFSSWLPYTDCCQGWGLGCDNVTFRVNSMTIGHTAEVSGQIPAAIGDLTGLEVLYFNDLPGLTGPIPEAISKLTNLQDLELFRTKLSGPISSSLARLKKLVILDLSENHLSGQIPPSLSLLNKLQGLNLAYNQLSGLIPRSFGFFKNLFAFEAQGNRLSGPIPRSLNRTGFSWVNLSSNHLTGDASILFGKQKKEISVELQNNALSFNLSMVEFPTTLHRLDLSHNMIYGSLPKQLAGLRLRRFDVSYNRLCGPIPAGPWAKRFRAKAFGHNICLCGAPLAPCKRQG